MSTIIEILTDSTVYEIYDNTVEAVYEVYSPTVDLIYDIIFIEPTIISTLLLAGKADSAHTHDVATHTINGFMSMADKEKLDGVAASANNYTHPTTDGSHHVPPTGTTNNGKVLTAGATEGSESWQAFPVGGIGSYKSTSIAISSDNTALFSDDLSTNSNIGAGLSTGYYITSGADNIGIGQFALYGNATIKLTGSNNVAIGKNAGYNITTGANNTLTGASSGVYLTTGSYNIFSGLDSGSYMQSGTYNVGIGVKTLGGNRNAGPIGVTGTNNVGLGNEAGRWLNGASNNNTLLGALTGTSDGTVLSNITCLGYLAIPSATSNEITLGNSSVTSLRCAVTTITALSDERDKTNIKNLDVGLDFINSLRPVSFNWNMRDGGKVGDKDIGFIAQELQQAQLDNGVEVPHLVMYENPDKLEAGYGMLMAPLVKAIQELTAKVEAQQLEINILKGA